MWQGGAGYKLSWKDVGGEEKLVQHVKHGALIDSYTMRLQSCFTMLVVYPPLHKIHLWQVLYCDADLTSFLTK